MAAQEGRGEGAVVGGQLPEPGEDGGFPPEALPVGQEVPQFPALPPRIQFFFHHPDRRTGPVGAINEGAETRGAAETAQHRSHREPLPVEAIRLGAGGGQGQFEDSGDLGTRQVEGAGNPRRVPAHVGVGLDEEPAAARRAHLAESSHASWIRFSGALIGKPPTRDA